MRAPYKRASPVLRARVHARAPPLQQPGLRQLHKVRLLAAHLAIPYETREVDVVDRSGREELLADVNPAQRVPTLVLDDGRPLAESNAILWYLGDGTRFVPDGRLERARVVQWMFFEQYDHEPAIAVARFLKSYPGVPSSSRSGAKSSSRAATEHWAR